MLLKHYFFSDFSFCFGPVHSRASPIGWFLKFCLIKHPDWFLQTWSLERRCNSGVNDEIPRQA
jgi:hypothetical protein